MAEVIAGAHFYDPPRNTYHERFRNVPTDPLGINWLKEVYKRSYKPLMDSGVLTQMSYDINGVLLHELKRNGLESDGFIRNKQDNLIGTPFIHPILPDLTDDDKRIVIGAGVKKYQQDLGIKPKIFWAPESALDLATMRVLREFDYQAFVCAPWQLRSDTGDRVDNRPMRIDLNKGASLIAIPYDRDVSAGLAFSEKSNADGFRNRIILPKLKDNQQLFFWTDGETYGHHFPFADLFIKYLLTQSLPEAGIKLTPINQLELNKAKLPGGELIERSAWSCRCGDLKRWHQACGCSLGTDASWKTQFYQTFARLNDEVTQITQQNLGRDYLKKIINNFEIGFINPGGKNSNPEASLIAAKVDALTGRTSCATFFNEPHTSGRINILFGLEAIQHLREAGLTYEADKMEGKFKDRLAEIIDPTNRSRNLLQVIEAVLPADNVRVGF